MCVFFIIGLLVLGLFIFARQEQRHSSAHDEDSQVKIEDPFTASSTQKTSQQLSEAGLETALNKKSVSFRPLGIVNSSDLQKKCTSLHGKSNPDVPAKIEIYEGFEEVLKGVEEFDYIYLLYACAHGKGRSENVAENGVKQFKGAFDDKNATCLDSIGFAILQLVSRDGNNFHVKGFESFENAPVLGIQPYFGQMDSIAIPSTKKTKSRS